jgi:hypothetical protein
VAWPGIVLVGFDHPREKFDQALSLARGERRHDSISGPAERGTQALTELRAPARQGQYAGPAVHGIDLPVNEPARDVALDELAGRDRVDAEAARQLALADSRRVSQQRQDGELHRREIMPRRDLREDAKTHLMKSSGEVSGDAVTLWDH